MIAWYYSLPTDVAGLRRLSVSVVLAVVAFALLLGGCAIKLAPDYQKEIVEGLTAANQDAMTLFASVAGGPRAADCSARADAYASVIGKFDAVRVLIDARPVPQAFAGFAQQEPASKKLSAPSLDALQSVIGVFTRMRTRDKNCSVGPLIVSVYKSEYEGNINDALTYEKALER